MKKPSVIAKLKRFNARIPATLEQDSAAIAKTLRKPRIQPLEGLAMLYALVDRYAKYRNGLVPCKSGCAYCCHSEVAVSELEADFIAQNTGATKLAPFITMEGGSNSKIFHDLAMPCPFLSAANLCTIYERRPMMCRTYWSFEDSSDPCSFDAGGEKIAMLDRAKSLPKPMEAYIFMVNKHGGKFADIRQWFAKQPAIVTQTGGCPPAEA